MVGNRVRGSFHIQLQFISLARSSSNYNGCCNWCLNQFVMVTAWLASRLLQLWITTRIWIRCSAVHACNTVQFGETIDRIISQSGCTYLSPYRVHDAISSLWSVRENNDCTVVLYSMDLWKSKFCSKLSCKHARKKYFFCLDNFIPTKVNEWVSKRVNEWVNESCN